MRLFVTSIIAILAWTLSIQWIKVSPPRPSPITSPCSTPDANQLVLKAMENRVLDQVYNDGESLWVNITPTWATLSGDEKQSLYDSLSCFAQQQDVSLRLVSFHHPGSREKTEKKSVSG